jgi:hypothetical protein
MTGEGDGPLSDCDDPECASGCSLTEFPVWMRPYRCRHLSAAERRVRRIVFGGTR